MRITLERASARKLTLTLAAAVSLAFGTPVIAEDQEPDMALGQQLNRQCALCHGLYSQGILGGKYPRLAGLPEYYQVKALRDYRDGVREHAAMVVVGGLHNMSDHDLDSLAAYLASIDLEETYPLNVPTPDGADIENGKDLYKGDCKTCHGRKGEGKAKKESPQIAGQYDGYLLRQIEMFKEKKRHHDNDPEDETFDDYTDQEILDIVGFVTTLDDKGEAPLMASAVTPEPKQPAAAEPAVEASEATSGAAEVQTFDIGQTVLKMGLAEGVTPEDAAEAMRSKAIELNMKLVGHQDVGKEVSARGNENVPHLEIFQFCDPEDAIKMVQHNTIYAAYMPCRIAMVEDGNGKIWLEMLNLDMIISAIPLPPELQAIAININGEMLDIITAGSTGEF